MRIIFENTPPSIHPSDMQPGQVAVISHCVIGTYVGRIVQRVEERLTELGTEAVWGSVTALPGDFQVRLLPKGTKLEV